ncbi:MAG TPA: ATP-binding cassette domain-containing protein [Ktedonobacteraceae bacterium]|nr:ATP-binding cassette domain-containing protein [Ktedonobacteraceae bacterium]
MIHTTTSAPPPTTRWSWELNLSGVSKRYGVGARGKWALQDLSLTISPGVFGLLGRNGAGKTTLLQILATLLEPTTGDICIGPYNLRKDRRAVRALLGFLPQEVGFFPSLTVKETLRYLGSLQGVNQLDRQIDAVLDVVNLRDRLKSRVGTLSGGMRRRLGLAQALLGNPRLLIIDEPTAGLDVVEQQRFRTLLGMLGAQGEQTILLSTHIVADVATMAGRLAVLDQGRLLFHGPVKELALRSHGRSWLWRTTLERLEEVRSQRQILITAITPVVDAQMATNEVVARIEGEQPAPEAVLSEPTLEDGYFSLIGGTSSDEDNYAERLAELRAIRKT